MQEVCELKIKQENKRIRFVTSKNCQNSKEVAEVMIQKIIKEKIVGIIM